MIDYFMNKCPLSTDSKILDIGCGQGVALEIFQNMGFLPVGITLSDEDIRACLEKGYQVYKMDQSFLTFHDETFDFIWCRHCIEHSIFPYYILSEFFRVLKPKGYLYLEVPAPNTICMHQQNRNHYSLFNKNVWVELIKRTGFDMIDVIDLSFQVDLGPDLYWAMIQKKPLLK